MVKRFKEKVLVLGILLIVAVFSFDWLVSDKLFYLFPNEMEWDTSPWYNFLSHNKKINLCKIPKDMSPSPPCTTNQGVLITGSSVALFSALPEQIELKLEEYGQQNTKVSFYSHVAMSSADLNYYLDDIIAKKPAVVMYLFNPVDFQLDHFREKEGKWEYSLAAWMAEYKTRFPVKIFYPWNFIFDFYNQLEKRDLLFLASKAALFTNRYRFFMNDPIDAYLERHVRSQRHYHNYTGAIPDNGIWSRGWTNQEFNIKCELKKGIFQQSVFIPSPLTNLEIQIGKYKVFKALYKTPGWKAIKFTFPLKIIEAHGIAWSDFVDAKKSQTEATLNFKSDKAVSSKIIDQKIYGKEYFYGIRLSQNFCKNDIDENIAYKRRMTLEDERFLAMNKEEYKNDYFDRLYRDWQNRPELGRMKLVGDRKSQLASQEFKEWIELDYLRKTSLRLKQAGIKFILVNNPENPLELNKYSESKWYKGLMQFVANMEGAEFYDLKSFISDPRMFIDFHHLTMQGALYMVEKYADILIHNKAEQIP